MTIHIDTNTLFILLGIAFAAIITLTTTTCVLIHLVRSMRNQMALQNRILYSVWKDTNQSKRMIDHTLDQIESIDTNMETLAQELEIHIQTEKEERERKIFPLPDLSKQIESTIREQFAIQIVLRKNMRVPIKGALEDISRIVQATYPNVDTEYIATRCIAFMESEFSDSNTESS